MSDLFQASLLVGAVFGVRHAFEADHLGAVATLVEGEGNTASTGVAWGLGHSMPIVALGVLFVTLDLQVPATVENGLEVVVALALVAMGVRAVLGRETLGGVVLKHAHGESGSMTFHRHVRIAGRRVGLTHSHVDGESVAIGIVHGLVGSGGVVVALAASSPTIAGGVEFLAGFTLATTCSMGLVAWGFGRLVSRAAAVRVAAGVGSVALGVILLV